MQNKIPIVERIITLMQTKNRHYKNILKLMISCVVLGTVMACAPRIDSRGNLPDPDLLANIEVGHVNKREVLEMIGSPSSIEPFMGESWYYISQKTQTTAFFKPKAIQRKVVIIRFDNKGIVKEVKFIGLDKGRNIKMVERTTPTAGKEITLIQQIFGNLGRFNKKGDGGDGIPRQ
jgi:outer membrane protein assembly factor BamE (lipoprotein component of BamABCDE complex)